MFKIVITWDGAPVRQHFGNCDIVCNGVATLADGREYRIIATATRGATRPELDLLRNGRRVPLGHMEDVRTAAYVAWAEVLKPIRDTVIAGFDAGNDDPRVAVDEAIKAMKSPAAPAEFVAPITEQDYSFISKSPFASIRSGGATLKREGESFVMTKGRQRHELAMSQTPAARLSAHWQEFAKGA